MQLAIHHQALPDTTAGMPVPEWLHLLPAGQWRGVDGRGPYKLVDPQAVITASMSAGKLPLDENHSTEIAKTTGAPSPARGWIDKMETRADGIWGHVSWNSQGQALVAERAYRGISPVFAYRADGTVLQIKSAALTNSANCGQLTTLHSQRDSGDMLDTVKLCAALGLANTAGETEILGAITALNTKVAAHSELVSKAATAAGVTATDANGLLTALASQKAKVAAHSELVSKAATAAGVTATDADGLLTALASQKASVTTGTEMATKVIALQSQVDELTAAGKKVAAVAYVDAQIAKGKPVAPLRDHFIARHMQDPASVEKEIDALRSVNTGGLAAHAQAASDNDGDEDLTEDEKATADKMGVKHDAMKAEKKRRKQEARK